MHAKHNPVNSLFCVSMQTANVLGVGIFTVLPLAALLIAGVVVYLRRRHL